MKKYFLSFFKYRYLLQDLIIKDIKIKYRRSVLGILWSILNPLLMMLVITAVFNNIFKMRVDNFPIYYLTGSIIYNLFSESTSFAISSIILSGDLIKKVYIPKYIFPLEKVIFSFVNFIFSLVAVIIMMLILKFKFTWVILLIPVPIFYTLIFSIGCSLILSTYCVFFRDLMHLYSVILTILMYATPIIYPVDILGNKMKYFIRFNPLYHLVNYFRQLMMYGTIPDFKININCFFISFIVLIIGIIIFKRKQDKFILYI